MGNPGDLLPIPVINHAFPDLRSRQRAHFTHKISHTRGIMNTTVFSNDSLFLGMRSVTLSTIWVFVTTVLGATSFTTKMTWKKCEKSPGTSGHRLGLQWKKAFHVAGRKRHSSWHDHQTTQTLLSFALGKIFLQKMRAISSLEMSPILQTSVYLVSRHWRTRSVMMSVMRP